MELKPDTAILNGYAELSFNRPIVELKHHSVYCPQITSNAFNRPIVELKPVVHDVAEVAIPSFMVNNRGFLCLAFNRTIVELKLNLFMCLVGVRLLLIEPLWN